MNIIRIKQASEDDWWYSNKIGEVFELEYEDKERGGYMVYDGWMNGGLVKYEDAELINDEE